MMYFMENPIKLGGQSVIVQVDETKLTHNVKFHRGRTPKFNDWELTMVDTSTTPAKGFAQVVENRSCKVLVPKLKVLLIMDQLFILMNGKATMVYQKILNLFIIKLIINIILLIQILVYTLNMLSHLIIRLKMI
jgi:hypothetical protein